MERDSSTSWPEPATAMPAAEAPPRCDALMLRLLDEIDYGLMVLAPDGRVRIANRPARLECAGGRALTLTHERLQAAQPADQAALRQALAQAQHGRRSLLRLGNVHVAVVPLADPPGEDHVLLVFGKTRVCEAVSVELFARAHRLTSAESKVLQALCAGAHPAAIAREFGVAISTVRTQLASLRQKTQAASIRDVVKQIAVLPPVVSALRGAWQ